MAESIDSVGRAVAETEICFPFTGRRVRPTLVIRLRVIGGRQLNQQSADRQTRGYLPCGRNELFVTSEHLELLILASLGLQLSLVAGEPLSELSSPLRLFSLASLRLIAPISLSTPSFRDSPQSRIEGKSHDGLPSHNVAPRRLLKVAFPPRDPRPLICDC